VNSNRGEEAIFLEAIGREEGKETLEEDDLKQQEGRNLRKAVPMINNPPISLDSFTVVYSKSSLISF